MKKFIIPVLIIAFIATGCKTETKKTEQTADTAEKTELTDLPDWQYVGYKVVHHLDITYLTIQEFLITLHLL